MPEIQEQIQDYRLPGPHPSLWLLTHPSPMMGASCGCMFLISLGTCRASVYICFFVWLRTKRTLGLGSLYGENDLLDLDGDPLRERHVAEKQLAALGDIL